MSRSYSRPKRSSSHFMEFFSEVIAHGARSRLPRSTYSSSATSRPERVVKVSRSTSKSPATSANR
ncbi:hypothetical protein WRSd5_03443 [Shigella dysenteriae WRSd5]|nr:hypothetical protein WRSd5_03443 [Shigella dysenteriae WRSd5]